MNQVHLMQKNLSALYGREVSESEARDTILKAQEKARFQTSIDARIHKGRKEETLAREAMGKPEF